MSSATYKLCEKSVRITAVEEVSEEVARQWMRDCEGWFEAGAPAAGLKGRLAWISTPVCEVVAKPQERTLRRTALSALIGRPARSTRAFRLGLALADTAVKTARPLALIERTVAGGRWESCLVMERIDAQNLREFLVEEFPREGSGGTHDPDARSRLLRAVSVAVAELHRASYRQRDLKAANLLVEPRDDGDFEVSLIDFDGMKRFQEPPPWRVRVRDLARLRVSFQALDRHCDLTPDDWESFVTQYLRVFEGRPPRPDEVRDVVAATGRWAARKIRRNRRRRRPVT